MKLKSSARVFVLLALLTIGGFGARKWYFHIRSKEQNQLSQTKSGESEKPVVQLQRMEPIELFDVFVAPGVVRSDGLTQVTTFSEGLVSNCKIRLGQAVVKGQLLCTIENDNPGNTFLPFPVEAPVSGRIGEIQVNAGARLNKGDKIATIIRSSVSKIELDVHVDDARRLRPGQSGTWTTGAMGGADSKAEKPTSVKISAIAPMPNMTTRTVRVELTPEKGDPGIPGTLGSVRFSFNSRSGFEIVDDALQYRGTNTFLRTVANSKVHWQPVKLGRSQKGKTEIISGIQNGDLVVIESNKFLSDGDEIVVKSDTYAKKGK
ncbi:efflux RND transporter periplasmic adaptor subunit [bacterium]|nr:efflux RND transporter periplasmic adaptor subunit [bacterium]